MLECVINISEGRRATVLDELSGASGASLRDCHHDAFHNRSVFTLINDRAPLVRDVRALIGRAFSLLDLRAHEGVHPRFGVVDVVPFVALDESESPVALELRDETARWIVAMFDVPTFLYGALENGERTLPHVRRNAFKDLWPDFGPPTASPTLGAVAVGARPLLVAWNLWLIGLTIEDARRIASSIRCREVRALAFSVGGQVQVSCNLIDPSRRGPGVVYDQVTSLLPEGAAILRAELVGLVPRDVLIGEDPRRWAQLDIGEDRTIEGRIP